MKKPTVKSLQRRADKLWSAIILKRAGYRCGICGEPAKEAHHILRKERNSHLRFDLRNGFPLCNKCHFLTRTDSMRVDYHIAKEYDTVPVLIGVPRTKNPWTVKSMEHVIIGLEHGLKLEG